MATPSPALSIIPTLVVSSDFGVERLTLFGAVLTPSTDWVSQTLLAVPMSVLYLLGVLEEFGIVCDPARAPFAFHSR